MQRGHLLPGALPLSLPSTVEGFPLPSPHGVRPMFSATYSPDDNKLRLYASSRLDPDTYARAKSLGFKWAPKQELFVAPAWTPAREDFLIELTGQIDDDDTSLLERAEQRAERYETFSANREADAERARAAVSSLASSIPLGQPILIGHHSEKHARRDAARIESGMRRAVTNWKLSQYWTDRAASALSHAKYKELPAVRARRIKSLEADLRKVQRNKADADAILKAWATDSLTFEYALTLTNYKDHTSLCFPLATYPRNLPASQYEGLQSLWSALGGSNGPTHAIITPGQARDISTCTHTATIAVCDRWINHYENRLAYERAMLDESGGLIASRTDFAIGGQVCRKGRWYIISKINSGSVSVWGHFAPTIPHDEITDYKPPTAEAATAVRKASKLPPLCNYPGPNFKHLTRAQLDAEPCRRWSDFPKTGRRNPTATYGAHRIHQTRGTSPFSVVGVYITDEKRKDPPPPSTLELPKADPPPLCIPSIPPPPPTPSPFADLSRTLDAGIQIVSAPQLFPTPPDIAAQMVNLADISPSMRVLEPSAGTGNLLRALLPKSPTLCAVEINPDLSRLLSTAFPSVSIHCADFLAQNGNLGTFDRVLMNPPFGNAADIAHVQHALHFLKPGGRLVGLCANGPRQQRILKPLSATWEELPPNSFPGTSVSVALFIIDAALT